MPVVVVESPAKARTISGYLGKGYQVLASYGHVRDLSERDGSVNPDNDFSMEWQVSPASRKHLRSIAEALKGDRQLILATDPDREGEAISWHLTQALEAQRGSAKDVDIRRVTFNAITRDAVSQAIEQPRQIDMKLVEAYLARRALDHLVGFKLSQLLWRKLPGARSAGRVQSVALRAVVDREMEIDSFQPREYWDVDVSFACPTPGAKGEFTARLVQLDGSMLGRFSLPDQAAASKAVAEVEACAFEVSRVEVVPGLRNPPPPFMTSTLQQEASRKLGLGARETMRVAQHLYEAGAITYMRTDSVVMSAEAVRDARTAIHTRFGKEYLPGEPRAYKGKVRNAQEAHECIRPTDMTRGAASVGTQVAGVPGKQLYDIILKRTLASQMASAKIERTRVSITSTSPDDKVGLRANGQVILFDGFLKLYEEGRDDEEGEEGKGNRRLPALKVGERLNRLAVTPGQHFTQPPPRYTEASLVRRMEELGVGRPSTYASMVSLIQEREYCRKEANRLIPEDKGRIVALFLSNYFERYVDYGFTAWLEDQLDGISAGNVGFKGLLGKFWKVFADNLAEVGDIRTARVFDILDEKLSPFLFPPRLDGSDPRSCPRCGTGHLSLKPSRAGGFIGCRNYPDCKYTRPMTGESTTDHRLIGTVNGDDITLRHGRFGPYIQRGEATPDTPTKPPRVSLPKGWEPESLDIDRALQLLALPREIGTHPEDGVAVQAGIGRYGPYIKHGSRYLNLKDVSEVFAVGINRAVDLLASTPIKAGRRGPPPPLKELGPHPDDAEPVRLMDGRYGPYVAWRRVFASLPKGVSPEEVTLETALPLLEERAAKTGTKAKKPSATKPAKGTQGRIKESSTRPAHQTRRKAGDKTPA